MLQLLDNTLAKNKKTKTLHSTEVSWLLPRTLNRFENRWCGSRSHWWILPHSLWQDSFMNVLLGFSLLSVGLRIHRTNSDLNFLFFALYTQQWSEFSHSLLSVHNSDRNVLFFAFRTQQWSQCFILCFLYTTVISMFYSLLSVHNSDLNFLFFAFSTQQWSEFFYSLLSVNVFS